MTDAQREQAQLWSTEEGRPAAPPAGHGTPGLGLARVGGTFGRTAGLNALLRAPPRWEPSRGGAPMMGFPSFVRKQLGQLAPCPRTLLAPPPRDTDTDNLGRTLEGDGRSSCFSNPITNVCAILYFTNKMGRSCGSNQGAFSRGEGGLRASAGMAQGRARLPGQARGARRQALSQSPGGALGTGAEGGGPGLALSAPLCGAGQCLHLSAPVQRQARGPPEAPIPGGNQNP